MDPLRTRLEEALRRRDELSTRYQRLLGRLEEAEKSLEELRRECVTRNVDPDRIDDILRQLEVSLEQHLDQYEQKLSRAQAALETLTQK